MEESAIMTTDSAARGQQTRASLLEAAVQLIVEEGWGAATTRKMAERAGVRPGVVHYHFGTVTNLLVEAALDTIRRELRRVVALFDGHDTPTGLSDMLKVVGQYTADDPLTVLMSETLLAATRVERLRVEVSTLLREYRAATGQWLRAQGVEDAEATAVVLSAALDGLVLHRMLDPELRAASLTGPLLRMAGVDPTAANSPESAGVDPMAANTPESAE